MTNMNLDVVARLHDGITRPAEGAELALDHLGASAARLTARATRLTTSMRGLAGVLRTIRATDTALGHSEAPTDRLRGAMGSIATAGRTGAKGIGSFTTSLGKMTTAANKATGAIDKLRTGLEAPIVETFIDRQNAALKEQVQLLTNAARLTSRLGTAGNGGGGRRGMAGGGSGGHMPGIMMAFQPDLHALRGVFEQATSLQDAIIKMHGMGLSDAEITRVRDRADEVAKLNRSTTPLRVINSVMEARSATGGNLDAAIKLAPEMANADQVFSRFLPKDQAGSAHDSIYDMIRAGELRNEINDPMRLHKMFESMIATTVYTQGRVNPRDTHKNLIYGRGAAQGWSDDFTNNSLPFFMQELKTGQNGGQAGVGLQAVFRAVALGVRKKSSEGEWRRIGMMDAAGRIVDENLAISDPDKFLAKVHRGMVGAGITGKEDQVKEYGKLFGTGTAQTMSMIGGFQQDRLSAYMRTKKQVVDSEQLVDLANLTLSQSTDNLKASFETLEGNVGSALTPTMTAFTDSATRAVRALNFLIAPLGQNGNDPKGMTGGYSAPVVGGAASAGALALWATGWAMKRMPFLGKIAAGGAGWAATGSPAGMAMAGPIFDGVKDSIAKLPAATAAGVSAGLVKGGLQGIALFGAEFVADKLLSALLPKPNLTPEKQAAVDKNRAAWDNAWIWQKPGLIWKDAFGKHESTETVAGQRAAGGPGRRGLTYLVGEKGPELFTPGLGGGISNNTVLGLMAGGGGDPDIGRSIRSMSFELASRIADLTKTLSRLGVSGGSGDGPSSGSGGGSSGSASGGDTGNAGGGGRRGMMLGHHRGGGSSGSAEGDATPATDLPASATNARLAMGRKKFFDELDRNPSLRRVVIKTASMENGRSGSSMTSVLESMVNRAQMRGYHSLNQSIHDGFYGPVNRGGLSGGLAEKARQYGEQAIKNVRSGSNQIGYRTDQGMLTDPGARKYMQEPGHSGWKRFQGENYFFMGPKGRAWAKQQQDADSRAAAQVPDALKAKAKDDADHRKIVAASHAAKKGGDTHYHVTNHIYPGQGHDEKKIADAVHQKFQQSVRSQLSDGAFA